MKHYKFLCNENWYAHRPSNVVMSKHVEIVYDQDTITDGPVGANRPDLLIRDKKGRKTFVVDISCPCDVNVAKNIEVYCLEERVGEDVGWRTSGSSCRS